VSEWYWKLIGETGRDNILIVIKYVNGKRFESMIILWCVYRNVKERKGE